MKAAVLHEVGKPLEIEDVAIADPGPFEVRIRTTATGVCHSDLHFIEGTWPHLMPAFGRRILVAHQIIEEAP